MFELNFEYIQKEAELINNNSNSKLIDTILTYDGVLPDELYDVFNPSVSPLGFPVGLCMQMQKEHGNNWIEHRRFESFNRPGETFEECNSRLIELLMDKTGLPIYIKK